MAKKFFFGNASGLNADIERHRAKERDLQEKIAELEGLDDEFSQAALRTYRSSLQHLQDSKASVLEKLGRKK